MLVIFLCYTIQKNLQSISQTVENINQKTNDIEKMTYVQQKSQKKLLEIRDHTLEKLNNSSRDIRKIYSHLICNSGNTRYYSKIKRHSYA